MSPTTTSTPVLPAADQIAGHLQPILIDLIDLSLLGKQAHWNLVGPSFASLHVMLDGMVDEYRIWLDDVAERMLALGVTADGRTATVTASSRLDDFPGGFIRDQDAVAWFTANLAHTATRLREHMAAIADLDPITDGLIQEILQGLEKQQWMIRSHIA